MYSNYSAVDNFCDVVYTICMCVYMYVCTRLAECVVAKEDDLGVNDTQFSCVSHLGNILNEGDVVLG